MPNIPIPRDVSSDTQLAFQEINRELNQIHVPVFYKFESVESLAEGSSAYFKGEDGILCRYTKIDGELYCEEIPRIAS